MKKASIVIIMVALLAGVLWSPTNTGASSNVVLASVEWVEKLITGVNTEVVSLKNQIATQKTEIDGLKSRIEALEKGTGGATPPAPPVTSFPINMVTTKANTTLHSGALKEYRVVTTIAITGTTLKVVDQFISSSGLWYRVEYATGQFAWVFSSDLAPTTAISTVTVVANSANVRRGAETTYASIALLNKGTSVKYIGKFTNSKGELWYNVELSSGARGWIHAALTEVK